MLCLGGLSKNVSLHVSTCEFACVHMPVGAAWCCCVCVDVDVDVAVDVDVDVDVKLSWLGPTNGQTAWLGSTNGQTAWLGTTNGKTVSPPRVG